MIKKHPEYAPFEKVIGIMAADVACESGFRVSGPYPTMPADHDPPDRAIELMEHWRTVAYDHDAGKESPPDRRFYRSTVMFDMREDLPLRILLIRLKAAVFDLKQFLEPQNAQIAKETCLDG